MKQIKYKECKATLEEPFLVQTNIFPEKEISNYFITLSSTGILAIKRFYPWDFASGPVIQTKSIRRPTLVHDAFYHLFSDGLLDIKWKEEADKMLMEMIEEDVNKIYSKYNPLRLIGKLRAKYFYWAVKKFGEAHLKSGNRRDIKTAP